MSKTVRIMHATADYICIFMKLSVIQNFFLLITILIRTHFYRLDFKFSKILFTLLPYFVSFRYG